MIENELCNNETKGTVMKGRFIPLDFSSQEQKTCLSHTRTILVAHFLVFLPSCPDLISVAHVDDEAHLSRPRKGYLTLKERKTTTLAQQRVPGSFLVFLSSNMSIFGEQ